MAITAENKIKLEQKRRDEIQTAAKRLFSIKGFSDTTVDAIAREAGISKGLVYHYFGSKVDILLSFADEMNEYLESLKRWEDPLEALKSFGTAFLSTDVQSYGELPPLQLLLITFANHEVDVSKYEDENPIHLDFGRNYLSIFFERGIKSGIFRKGNPEMFGDVYWSFLLGKLLPVKKGNENEDPEVYVDEVLSLFKTK